jgi:hypothetical protein
MAINKKLIHFNKKATFNSQKLSANDSNTQYQVGGTGTVQTGAPDINYQSIVYIKDSKEIWTHGQFYATAVTWSTITGKPSFATVATSGNYNDLSNKPTIPTKLPTPNVLTFTGAVTGTWDGSAAKTVNIPAGSSYTLPPAAPTTLGGIKVGYTTSGKNYKVQIDGNNNAYVNVPWTDTNTTYSQATSSALGLVKIGYTESGKNYPVELNSSGQMFVNVPWTDTDTKYTLPTATASVLGGIKIGSGLSISNGVVSTGNYVSNVTVGSPSIDWQSAYVPMTVNYRDGSTADRNISLPMASGSGTNGSAGLMSGADKKKLDGLSSGDSNIIKSRDSYVECNMSTDKISIYAPSSTVEAQGVSVDIHDNDKTTSFRMNDVGEITMNANGTITLTADNNVFINSGQCQIEVGASNLNITGGYDMYIDMNPRFLGGTVQVGESGTSVGISLFGDLTMEGDIVCKGAADFTSTVAAGGGFFDTSDARVKTNVKELDASKADKVRLVEFDRTDVEHHGYGVIAQELEKVYPEMVNTDSEGFKSVNYNELAMVKIKYLEDKVARLEALVGRLLAE